MPGAALTMNPVRKQPLRTASGSWSSWSAGLPCGEGVFNKSRSQGPFDTAEEKRRFIAEHRHLLETVERGWQIMNLPRSTYYHKPKVASDDQDLINDIESIIEEFPGYGYRRVTRELHRRGKPDNHKKLHRIMRERGVLKKPKRRWVKTTDSIHNHRIYPNLILNLAVTGPNQVWSADISYISIRNAFVYLAVILDLFARRAVGYAISRNIDTVVCLEALQMAIENRQTPEEIIHHCDRGAQYPSHD